MQTEIKEQLKQIELAMLKGLTPQEIISHFAEMQKRFEEVIARNDTLEKRAQVLTQDNVKQEKEITRKRDEVAAVTKERDTLLADIKRREAADMRWTIEREYSEKIITTLKDIMSAALTRSALEGKGFLNFSAYQPQQYGQANASGSIEVGAKEELKKPEIK